MNIRSLVTSAALAGIVVTLSTSASAEQTGKPAYRTDASGASYWAVPVRYSDLNLAVPAGREALAKRLQAAARKVCQGSNQHEDFADTTCATRAYHRAERKMLAATVFTDTAQLAPNDR